MAIYLGIANDGTFASSEGYALYDSDGLYLKAMYTLGKLKVILNGVTYNVNVKFSEKESE